MTGLALEACVACDAPALRPALGGRPVRGFDVLRCGACGLVQASPRPSPEELARFYADGYWGDSAFGYADPAEADLHAAAMWPGYLALLRTSGIAVGPRPRLLDVGCGSGGFIAAAAAAGWDVLGSDLSPEAARLVREVHGVRAHGGCFLPPEEEGSFDHITLWHCLEHTLDPAAAVQQAAARLEPSGSLFVELPNWNSLGRIVRRSDWSALTPPEHLNFFTAPSLVALLRRAGLRAVRTATPYEHAEVLVSSRLPGSVGRRAGGLAARAIDRLRLGGNLRVVAVREVPSR